jgi:hypothetical protein
MTAPTSFGMTTNGCRNWVPANACIRLVLSVWLASAVVTVAGCRKRTESIPAGSFRVAVEEVVDDHLVLVKRITITAPGRRRVGISAGGNFDWNWGDPDRETGLMSVHMISVAQLIRLPSASENVLRGVVRMKSGGGALWVPLERPAGTAASLRDLLSLRLDSGIHPLSRDLTLGYLPDRELILRVE